VHVLCEGQTPLLEPRAGTASAASPGRNGSGLLGGLRSRLPLGR
jgi:hypothetical protein